MEFVKASNCHKGICHTLAMELPCPDSMIGSLAAIPLPNRHRS
jgi:hypothetical protein